MKKLVLCLVFLEGCVPFPLYQDLQKKLSVSKAEINDIKKKLEACEDQKKELKAQPKASPAKISIEQDELEAIKKQSLREAEHNLKLHPQEKK
jgi:hypothetical protein